MSVRTTITLDPDVDALVKKLMRRRGLSFKDAVNTSLRQALAPAGREAYVMPVFDLGRPSVDLTHALRVASAMEDDDVSRELGVGR